MGNKVVHFEMNGPDAASLAKFYSDMFGWHVQEMPDVGYWIIDTHAGAGINGGIGQPPDGTAFTTFYVESKEPEALMEQAETAGAKVVMPITENQYVTVGLFADPDGLIVGIVKGGDGEQAPGPSAGDNPPVDWFEILGSDAERTQNFYRDLFGWQTDDSGFGGYRLVRHDHDAEGRDLQIGGGLGSGDGTTWVTVYALVPDVEAALQKAESLGGKRAYGPNAVGDTMKTGAFHDPTGNPFGVYQTS
jgi:predicted enzyme related to lactoylglutathione lyase